MIEKWKDIPTYEGLYQASTQGRIKSLKTNTILSPDSHGNVGFYKDSKQQGWKVHTLVACTFLGLDITDPYRHRVLFRDDVHHDCSPDNLYIEDTSSYPGEEWQRIEFANNKKLKPYYMISSLGRVKSIAHELHWMNYGKDSVKYVPEMILSTVLSKSGYKFIWLATEQKPDVNAQVHRLVASAFCTNDDPEHKVEVNHIDGNKSNNYASNLEWVTRTENVQHALRTGLKHKLHRTMRYPVKRLETGEVFNSMSDAERAMGRCNGYLSQMTQSGHTCTDVEGNVWTVEIMEDVYQYVPTEGTKCYFEEEPDKIYISMSEASKAIGRYSGYLHDFLNRKSKLPGKITSPDGREWHLHIIEE